jgi:hypothetical protein
MLTRHSRLFGAHVYGHHLVFDLQTAHAGHQSPNRRGCHPAVHTEYRSEPFLLTTYVCGMASLTFSKHIVVCIIRVDDGLVKYRNTYPGGPVAFFADISQETYIIKHALYILQTLLADGVVVCSYFHLPV